MANWDVLYMALNVFIYIDVLRLRELASVEFGRK
jgi:hypothetical protein